MILWLTGKTPFSSGAKILLLKALRTRGVNPTDVFVTNLYRKAPNLDEYEGPRTRKMPPAGARKAALHELSSLITARRPKVIVCNDEATCRALTGEAYALGTVRGSIYYHDGVPVLIIDAMKSVYALNHGKFVLEWDLDKLARWAQGKQVDEPTFDHRVCRSVAEVEFYTKWLIREATLVSEDVETSGGFVTVQSFTFDTYDHRLITFTIPYFDPRENDGAYWRTEEAEIAVRKQVCLIHNCEAYKTFSNGMYDNAYFIEAAMPPINWLFDTQYMQHSAYCESPKSLNFVASLYCDHYVYWKDEVKGYKEDALSDKNIDSYWRYNGLDTYWTWLSTKGLVNHFRKIPYAYKNYSDALSLAAGPVLAASLRGMRGNKDRLDQIVGELSVEAAAALQDCRDMVGEGDYNPNSGKDASWFIYDILGARATRIQRKGSKLGPRSVDEKVLKLLKEQRNIVLNHYIDLHLEYKKPQNNINKYGNWWHLTRGGRFMSWLNPCATETSRFNSTNSQFWVGTNAQNIPAQMREWIVADPDYVLVEVDASASDDRFIAYHSEDQAKIDLVESGKDGHCFHASIFFQKPYEEILAGYKKRPPEQWVVHSTKGVRQNTKRLVHGRNFGEGAATAYNVMGRDAVVATANALGYNDAVGWHDKELIGIIQKLFDRYDHPRTGFYKRLRAWQEEIIPQLIKAKNLAATAFGFTRKFFGDAHNDHSIRRKLCSFYGQGGTAGNLNRALRRIWYSGIDDGRTCLFLLQVHDSLIFAIHRQSLAKISEIVKIMELPITINGRTFSVPASAKCGLTWSENMLTWTPETTYEDIVAFEKEQFGAKFSPEANKDWLKDFENILDTDTGDEEIEDDELLDLGLGVIGPMSGVEDAQMLE